LSGMSLSGVLSLQRLPDILHFSRDGSRSHRPAPACKRPSAFRSALAHRVKSRRWAIQTSGAHSERPPIQRLIDEAIVSGRTGRGQRDPSGTRNCRISRTTSLGL
jgi:hypothetical protein